MQSGGAAEQRLPKTPVIHRFQHRLPRDTTAITGVWNNERYDPVFSAERCNGRLTVRASSSDSVTLQSVDISVPEELPSIEEGPAEDGALFFLSSDGEEIPLREPTVVLPAGDYLPLMGPRDDGKSFKFFCTAGCSALPFDSAASDTLGVFAVRIRLEQALRLASMPSPQRRTSPASCSRAAE